MPSRAAKSSPPPRPPPASRPWRLRSRGRAGCRSRAMARWKRPSARGLTSRSRMLMAPADSPNTVTLAGSPPKPAMLRLHPPQSRDLVEQTVVAGHPLGGLRRQGRVSQEAQRTQPVVDGHHHHALGSQVLSAVDGHRARTGLEAAPVDPHHDREPLVGRLRRRPHVEVETVFVGRADVEVEELALSRLRARGSERGAGQRLGPRCHGLRRLSTADRPPAARRRECP